MTYVRLNETTESASGARTEVQRRESLPAPYSPQVVQLGGFGDTKSNWKSWIIAAYRTRTPGISTATTLLSHAATPPADGDAWVAALPTMSCSEMCRSIGLGYDAAAICAAFDEALGVSSGQGWLIARQDLVYDLAAEEAKKWEVATCADRASTDGGGAICTARDGSTQIRCFNNADPTLAPVVMASGRCPAGTGGMAAGPGVVTRGTTVVRTTMAVVTTGLRGRVVDSAGRGIAGAAVVLAPAVPAGTRAMLTPTNRLQQSTADASGNFTVKAAPGSYDVTVSATGYTPMKSAGVVVGATGITDGGVVTMSPVADAAAAAAAEEAARQAREAAAAQAAADAAAAAEMERQRQAALAKTEEEEAWYKSPWVWLIGGAVVIGGSYLVWQSMQEKKA